jgi:hypothetical protein
MKPPKSSGLIRPTGTFSKGEGRRGLKDNHLKQKKARDKNKEQRAKNKDWEKGWPPKFPASSALRAPSPKEKEEGT